MLGVKLVDKAGLPKHAGADGTGVDELRQASAVLPVLPAASDSAIHQPTEPPLLLTVDMAIEIA
jgi:hypothetical protein